MTRVLPLITFLLLAISSTSFAAEPPIKIGALLHISGEFAVQGVAFRQGVELAVAEVNSAGGVNGTTLEAVFEDTQYRPLLSNSGARKLTQVDKVAAVLISTVTEAKAASAALKQAKVPSIVLWDSSPEIEALGDTFFGIGPWAPSSGEMSAEFAIRSLHAKRAIAVSSNTEWSQYVNKFFVTRFKSLGGEIMHEYVLNPDEHDFRSVLTKIRAAIPDVIYAPVDGNIIPFYQQAKQMRLPMPIVTSDVVTEEYLESEAKSFDGVYQTMSGDPAYPESKAMYEKYRKHFGKPITQAQFVAWGYDGVMLVADALKRSSAAGGLTKALLETKNLKGASGEIAMNEHRSAPRSIRVFRVKDGAFQIIEP